MSVANLIKLGVCGRYPYAYILRTKTLVEAEGNGGVFSGAVGNFRVDRREDDKEVNDSQDGDSMGFSGPPSWLKYVSFRWFRPLGDYRGRRCVPIIGSLIFHIAMSSQPTFMVLLAGFNVSQNTRGLKFFTFNAGQSTRAQRIWMLGWVSTNMFSAPLVHFVASGRGGGFRRELWVWALLAYVFAFGGFVTVGGMLHAESSYQLC